MRIDVDMTLCESHGQCVFAAPEVFSFDDDDRLVHPHTAPDTMLDPVTTAATSCPVRAITLTRTTR